MQNLTKEAQRKQLIKLIHIARRELGMQDEDYRAMLANIPALEGATSSASLTIPKLKLVLETLKGKGFRVVPRSKKPQAKLADDPQSKLIRHLWLSLHAAGKVRDPSESALAKYAARLTKVDQLQWLNSSQAAVVIESLKQWLGR